MRYLYIFSLLILFSCRPAFAGTTSTDDAGGQYNPQAKEDYYVERGNEVSTATGTGNESAADYSYTNGGNGN